MKTRSWSNFILFIVLFLPVLSAAKPRLNPEKFYQEKWCLEQDGNTRIQLSDGTWPDCVTQTHAVEVDFADKWAEAPSQAIHYATETGKEPGVLIIMENPEKDWKYLPRLYNVLMNSKRKIKVWFIEP